VFDFGLTRASTKFVAELVSAGERDAVPAVAWTAMTMQLALGVVGGAVLLAVARPLADHILRIPPELIPEAEDCFLTLSAAIPVVLVFNLFRGLLEAGQRFDLINYVRIPFNALYFLLPLAAVYARWSLGELMAGFIFAWAIGALIQFRCCVAVYPALARKPLPRRAWVRRLLRFGGWATVSGVVSPVLVYTDRVLIGMEATISAVGYYSAPFDMVSRLLVIPSSLVSTLFPAFSAASAAGDSHRLQLLLARATKYLLLLIGPLALAVCVFAPSLLSLWLGRDFAHQSSNALRFLAIGILVNALAQVPFALVQGVGRPEIAAKFHLAELPIHIILLYLGVRFWGITGAAVAWTLRVTLDAALLYGAAVRLTTPSTRAFMGERLPQAIGMFLSGALAIGLVVGADSSLPHQLAAALALAFVGVGIVWRCLFSDAERASFGRLIPRTRAQFRDVA